jgi:hypothetical protein
MILYNGNVVPLRDMTLQNVPRTARKLKKKSLPKTVQTREGSSNAVLGN